MVKIRFTTKSGKSWISTFPRNTLSEVRTSARGINPKIVKVEYARKIR